MKVIEYNKFKIDEVSAKLLGFAIEKYCKEKQAQFEKWKIKKAESKLCGKERRI